MKKALINNKTGLELYEKYSKNMPIFDYHCHLEAREIAEDISFKNITEMWLKNDHYKWRAMRINGIEEKYITGDADDFSKFLAFAKTLEKAIGNPLYNWAQMELESFFGIDDILNESTAEKIYEKANEKIKNLSANNFIKRANVTDICTTDDPIDDLKYHKEIAKDESFNVRVYPTFRPDRAFKIDKTDFSDYILQLEKASNREIKDIDSLIVALKDRIIYFKENGGFLADHGFEDFVFKNISKEAANEILSKKFSKDKLSNEEVFGFRSYVIFELAKIYKEVDWTMQMHIGALRNTNSKSLNILGENTGFDSMGDFNVASNLVSYLDSLYEGDFLPRTILYNLNEKDNEVFSSMMGNYPVENSPCHVIHGTAWWFNDQKFGIEAQITAFANNGLLGRFLGMVTDSRSFLSYSRHDYFRRVVCNLLGSWSEGNLITQDIEVLGKLVKDISYNNAVEYFSKGSEK